MKISLLWLKDYVSIDADAQLLSRRLTMAGLEVEQGIAQGKDTIFEIEVTPNRSDCLSILGVAREVSAIFNKSLKFPQAPSIQYPSIKCNISMEDKKDCGRYIGTLIEGVRILPAARDIKERIGALGLRAINNVVDITNFCLMETGQPLHAFDYDKLIGGVIIVRRAKTGERIVTLDGVDRALDPSILVIADAKRPVAIAGIMGGKETEVTTETRNVLLESAYFNPILIRRAARKLGISTDSSYRFERNVDRNMVETGSRRAVALILTHAGGKIAKHSDKGGEKSPGARSSIKISLAEIQSRLGVKVGLSQCKNIFTKLEFKTKVSGQNIVVTPPAFRQDVKQGVDLIEEIARIVGYDQVPSTMPSVPPTSILQNREYRLRRALRESLLAQGFSEIVTYTMLNQAVLAQSGQAALQGIRIRNPLTTDQEIMRPTLLPSFLAVVKKNINRGQMDLRLFEVGKVYRDGAEHDALAIMISGNPRRDWRVGHSAKNDFYDLRGAIESSAEYLRIREILFEPTAQGFLDPTQSAVIKISKDFIGVAGKIHSKVLAAWDIKQTNVYFAQILLKDFFVGVSTKPRFVSIPEFPAVVRDVSLAVPQHVSFGRLRQIVFQNGKDILAALDFKEEYLGDKIPAGQRGLVFSLTYQSAQRTLTETEVNAVHENIVTALTANLGAIRR